ncbi:malate dehydrogenase [Methanoregula sp.]|uniref:malate dehydrogenase n=1 Tax=Methanoregula sp. TaxID=2052170 RepID=UPI002BA262A6|nr:lactate dehydrogenase [Methanoregula sp.]HVP97330.1 lactate dehydrogenase [Methanoregula sp.]
MTKLAVMGVGRIGGEVASLAAVLGLADELVLYDLNKAFLSAQVLDIRHTGLPVTISTDTRAIKEADICIFAAGIPRSPEIRARADLLAANLPVARKCGRFLEGFSGLLITVTNPMDVNNYLLHRFSGLPRERCIGFGGQLDSARFALALRRRRMEGPATVLGEHGEHQVPVFSRLAQPVEKNLRLEILRDLQGASMEVIQGKGGTVYGPAFHIVSLVRMLLSGTRDTVPCSAVLDGEYNLSGCSLGVPVRIRREGIREIVTWNLDEWETAGMMQAGEFVRTLCQSGVA